MMMMKAGNSGDIAYCLLRCYSRRQNDVMTSFSVYLFTVPVNLVYVKLWGLATKIRFCSITYIIQKGMAPKKLMKVFPKKKRGAKLRGPVMQRRVDEFKRRLRRSLILHR